MSVLFRRLAGLLAGVLLAAGGASGETLQRGVLIDREARQALLMHPEGGVEAVDLGSGTTRWHNRDAELPVLLHQGELVAVGSPAKRGLFAYTFIDAATGATRASGFAELPKPARAVVDDRLGEHFAVAADPGGVAWHYVHEHITGALLPVDSAPVPESGPSSGKSLPEHAPRRIERSGLLRVQSGAGKLVNEDADVAKHFAPQAIEIGQPDGRSPRQFLSEAGGHRLESAALGGGRFSWVIRDAAGTTLGKLYADFAYLPFEVTGNLLLFVLPLRFSFPADQAEVHFPTLVAHDLAASRVIWTREVRDTAYHGPFPP